MRRGKAAKLGCLAMAASMVSITFGSIAQAAPSTTISFEVAEYSSYTVPYWQNVVKKFEAANPNIHVDLTSIAWGQAQNETVRQIAANALPDVVNTATIWLPQWVSSGALQPVSPSMLSGSVRSDILPALYNVASLYKGKIWGLPWAAGTRALFYNKGLFQQAGLNPNDPPTDWAEMYSDAQAIKAKTGSYGYAFEVSDQQAFRYFGYLLINDGGSLLAPNGSAAFDSQAGINALSFLVKANKAGLSPNPISNSLVDLETVFKAGKIGQMIDDAYFFAEIPKGTVKWGVERIPVGAPGIPGVNWGVTDVLVINKNVQASSLKPFLDYIYQTDIQAKWDAAEGFTPLEQSELTYPAFDNPVEKLFVQMTKVSRFDPFSPDFSQLQVLLKTAEQEALLGKETPAQALAAAAKQFDALPGA
ncbi:MAG TPA: sugar ABC transporter substrate-binding protein [Acidimicrobiales bacterium]|nr:sugar ABC transporter substrate-binding protein [Acidimicrobiales bacterium]